MSLVNSSRFTLQPFLHDLAYTCRVVPVHPTQGPESVSRYDLMNTPDKMTLQATVDQDGARGQKVDAQTWSDRFALLARIFILLALMSAPWMFGSVEFWSQFWISSALLIALALWWFDTALNKRNVQVVPYLAFFLVAGVLIGLIQLMPLPSFLADSLLGRQAELYSEFSQPSIDSNQSTSAARISLNANGTWHHIRLLILALAIMLLSCRYFRTPRDLLLLLTAMTVNGVVISLFGVVQKLTTDGTTLFWSIPLKLGGVPFGPYVNRNNSAGYLLICLGCSIGLMVMVMSVRRNRGPVPIISEEIPFWRQLSQQLLYFISELTATKLAALLAVAFIGLGIVASLSRGAVLGLGVATIASIMSYGLARRPKNMSVVLLPVAIPVFLLAGWLGFSDDLISRIDKVDSTREVEKWDERLQTWSDSWPSVGQMGKLGSGLGTYESISRLYRTNKETDRVYKFAENQYFQSLVEAGWLGLIIYLLAWAFSFHCAYFLLKIGQSPATVTAGVVGVFVLWAQAVASFFDFGFYIPANTIAMGCLMGVVSYYAHSMAYRLKQKSFLRFHFPNTTVQVLLVILFAFSTVVTLDLNRKSRIESLRSPRILNHDTMTYEQVDQKIRQLSPLASNSKSYEAMNELGRLGIHRARLELFDFFKAGRPSAVVDAAELQRTWDETSLVRLQERSETYRRESKLSQSRFLGMDSIQLNLPYAKHWFEESLRQNPMQPEVQITLGEISSILFGIDSGREYLERSILIAPSNAILLKQVAVLYIQAGEFSSAAPHLSRYLELDSRDFDLMMQIVTSQMNTELGSVDQELILNEMLPDDPDLLFHFATQYAEPESLIQKIALEKAEVILEQVSQSNPEVKILKGRVRLAMGDNPMAIDLLNQALVNNPNDETVRYDLIQVLIAEQRFDEAELNAKQLIRTNGQNRRYRNLLNSIKSTMEEMRKN